MLIFVLTCWNAFDRPRHIETTLVKQLVADGVLYFIVSAPYLASCFAAPQPRCLIQCIMSEWGIYAMIYGHSELTHAGLRLFNIIATSARNVGVFIYLFLMKYCQ